ncbi:TPA: lysine--tRNA ligase, partial [Neisseria meningitidis]
MSEQNHPQTEPQLDENQIIALRREKLHNIRQQRNAYPNDFKRDSFAADLHT